MRALVTYGSKMGGTQGLAEMVGNALEARGFAVDLSPARDAELGAGYDLVVVGGALYAGRWHRDAVQFVRRHADALHGTEVWFFSSGPLDESATTRDIPPVKQVAALMAKVDAHGHATFGGRLVPKPRGFVARMMAKKLAGDWRDADHVERWVDGITAAIGPVMPIPEL
jgi:menaquinone-dependent protoporphyrinogen oxidase